MQKLKGLWIPAEILLNEDLSGKEKIILSMIFYKPVSNMVIENTEFDEKIENAIIEKFSADSSFACMFLFCSLLYQCYHQDFEIFQKYH